MRLRELIERGLKLRTELAWVVMGQMLGFVGSFIGIKVLTNVLGPKGYGELALGLTIAGLFNMYLYGPLANVVARFYAIYRERQELGLYFAVLKQTHGWLALSLTLLAGLAGLLLWPWLGAQWALIGLAATLYGVVAGINASYISLQSAIRQRQVVALHQGADVWLRTGLSILLLTVAGANGFSALSGYVLGTLLITVSQALFARRNGEIAGGWKAPAPDRERLRLCRREFAGYAASFMVFSGFAAISMYADRWIIQGLYNTRDVGIYAAIGQIALAPANLTNAMINQLMVPIIFEHAGSMTTFEQQQKSDRLILQTFFIAAFLNSIMIVTALFLHREIVSLFTSISFVDYSSTLWIILTGCSIFNLGQILSIKGSCFNRPNIYFIPKLLQSVSFVGLAYILGKQYELVGVASAGLISSSLYTLLVAVYNSKLRIGK